MYSLTPSEHREIVKAIVEEVRGRVPVIAGTGVNCQIASELARESANLGADAILALPPYYPNPDDDGLGEYYAAIGSATPLPLFVYSRDWVNPSPAWVEKLAARVPTLLGWKDGQGNPSLAEEITRERIELLGTSFIPQHSDARVLEQVIYKWRNTRATLAPLLAESYRLLCRDGRGVGRQEIERDVKRLFVSHFARSTNQEVN